MLKFLLKRTEIYKRVINKRPYENRLPQTWNQFEFKCFLLLDNEFDTKSNISQ